MYCIAESNKCCSVDLSFDQIIPENNVGYHSIHKNMIITKILILCKSFIPVLNIDNIVNVS